MPSTLCELSPVSINGYSSLVTCVMELQYTMLSQDDALPSAAKKPVHSSFSYWIVDMPFILFLFCFFHLCLAGLPNAI